MGRMTSAKNEQAEQEGWKWEHALKTGTEKLKANVISIEDADRRRLAILKGYEKFFVRDIKKLPVLKSKNDDRRMIAFVRHLFNKYPVPAHLNDVWTREKNLPRIDTINGDSTFSYRDWYLCVAQGGSFYKQHAKTFLTKAEVHYFLTCPFADFTLEEALWFAVAKGAGASNGFAHSIAKTKLCRFQFNDFWRRAARWFVQYETEKLNVAAMNDVLDYIDYRHRQSATFSLSGHTLVAIKQRTEHWHRDLARMKSIGGGMWEGQALPDAAYTTGKNELKIDWTITQIKTGNDLAAEGNAQRHCVAAYKGSCISGHTSIWSLKKNNARALTIQVQNNGEIVQARGLANRPARADELNIMNTWARQVGLTVRNYL